MAAAAIPERRAAALASQRRRLFAATAEVIAERGLRGATAVEVTRRAGISRAALVQHFDDLDDCFVALVHRLLRQGVELTAKAFQREARWDDGVLAGLEALPVFLDSDPACARACLLKTLAGSSPGFQSRAQTLGRLGRLVDTAARRQLAPERQPPASTAEAIVVSVLGMLRARLLSGEAPPFVGLLGPLTEVVVAPYFGPSAAAHAASMGCDRARALQENPQRVPAPSGIEIPAMLRHASSHRLRSCLRYLAKNPNASNQAVGEGIGISHSGQVSTLLARLYEGGLLVKVCGGAGRPNAWRLSPYGVEVARVLRRGR